MPKTRAAGLGLGGGLAPFFFKSTLCMKKRRIFVGNFCHLRYTDSEVIYKD